MIINGDLFDHLPSRKMCPLWLSDEMAHTDTLITNLYNFVPKENDRHLKNPHLKEKQRTFLVNHERVVCKDLCAKFCIFFFGHTADRVMRGVNVSRALNLTLLQHSTK